MPKKDATFVETTVNAQMPPPKNALDVSVLTTISYLLIKNAISVLMETVILVLLMPPSVPFVNLDTIPRMENVLNAH
jgi:hypothetical protein